MKIRQTGLLAMTIFALGLSTNVLAANTSANSDERSIYSDSATNERLAPVGNVCIKGQECVASSGSVAAGDSDSSGSGLSPEEVFDSHCSACHKTGVAGAPVFGNKDDWKPHIAKGEDTLYHSALNGFNAMPPKGMCSDCSDDEIEATVRYMVNHSGGDFKEPAKSDKKDDKKADNKPAEKSADKTAAADTKAESDKKDEVAANDDGRPAEEIFDSHCAMCHKTGAAGAPVFGNKDDWAPHIEKGKDTLYHSAINGFNAMPPKGMCMDCTDDELEATVNYMVNHSGGSF